MKAVLPAAAIVVAAAAVAGFAGSAPASAPPVGPLPPSPVTTITTVAQELVAFALPRGESGLVWRAAGPYDPRVVRPAAEADIPNSTITVLVYRAVRPGTALVNFGLTNGEHRKAYRAARFRVIVKPRG